jgi:hypothetical protein
MRGRGRRVLGMQVLGRDGAEGFVALDELLTKVAASHSWNGGGEELRLGQKLNLFLYFSYTSLKLN